jgi:hypothetical protein
MSNMSLTAINLNDSCFASVADNNFDEVTSVINGNLDSDNYAVSSVKSKHVSSNAIHSEHIADSNVASEKIAAEAIVQSHVVLSGTDGLQLLQYGTNMPANGVVAGRYSQTLAVASNAGSQTYTFRVNFSDALDGDPGFTSPPNVCEPFFGFNVAALVSLWSAGSGEPRAINAISLDAGAVDFKALYSFAHEAHTATIHMIAEGEK